MISLFLRLTGWLLLACVVLVLLVRAAGDWRAVGALLVHVDRVATPPTIRSVVSDTGLSLQEDVQGAIHLAPDACRYLTFQRNFPDGSVDMSVVDLRTRARFDHRFVVPSELRTIAWTPDGGRVALLRENRSLDEQTLTVVEAASGTLKNLAGRPVTVNSRIAWSPDGTWLAFTGYDLEQGDGIFLYDLTSETITPIIDDQLLSAGHRMIWSPDSRYLLTIAPVMPAALRLIDPQTGAVHAISDLRAVSAEVAWAPHGRTLAVAGVTDTGDTQRLYRVNPADGTYEAVVDMPVGAGFAAWSPDGRYLPYLDTGLTAAAGQPVAELVDMQTGERWPIPMPAVEGFQVRWTPDSRLLVSRMERQALRLVDVRDQRVTDLDAPAFRLVGWLDNTRLVTASADQGVQMAVIDGLQTVRVMRYALAAVDGLCFSSNVQ